MARPKDPVVADVKRIRKKLSKRLMAAHRRGQLHEELLAMGRQAERSFRGAANGSHSADGRGRKK